MLKIGLLSLLLFIGFSLCQRSAYYLKQAVFRNYNSQSRPVWNSSTTLNVCVGLFVLQIMGLSEKSQNDSFLKWDPNKYDNVSQLYVKANSIWTPDIIVMDSPDEKSTRSQKDDYLLKVQWSGLVQWQFQTVTKNFCQIDIMNFPFDEQHCSIRIRSSGRDASMIRIIKRNHKVKVMKTIETEWFITNSDVEETNLVVSPQRDAPGVTYSMLQFRMSLRRRTIYYFLKIIFPFCIITWVPLFTFLLVPDSSEKLTLNVTVLLSLVIYLQAISDYIPRGFNKVPMLSFFSLANFFLVYLSSVFSVLVLRLYYKLPTLVTTRSNELPFIFRVILFKIVGPLLLLNFECRKRNQPFSTSKKVKSTQFNKNKVLLLT